MFIKCTYCTCSVSGVARVNISVEGGVAVAFKNRDNRLFCSMFIKNALIYACSVRGVARVRG